VVVKLSLLETQALEDNLATDACDDAVRGCLETQALEDHLADVGETMLAIFFVADSFEQQQVLGRHN